MVNIISASTVPPKCQLYNSVKLNILIGLIMLIVKTKQSCSLAKQYQISSVHFLDGLGTSKEGEGFNRFSDKTTDYDFKIYKSS